MNDQTHEQKEDGKIQPIKLTPEELEKRKETGYKTDEESRRTPSSSGQGSQTDKTQNDNSGSN